MGRFVEGFQLEAALQKLWHWLLPRVLIREVNAYNAFLDLEYAAHYETAMSCSGIPAFASKMG